MPLPDLLGGSGIAGQQPVFRIEQPRRLVGPLDVAAELVKIPRLIPVERALGDAGEGLAGFLDFGQQIG